MPSRFLWLLSLTLLSLASAAGAQTEEATEEPRLVVVVADESRGPSLTQLFAAVLKARVSDVDVRYLPEATWSTMATRPAAALLFRLDTSDDAVWMLRLVHGDRAWQRRLRGVAQDPAAIEAAALIAARASVALLTQDSLTERERPEELTAWTPKEVQPKGSEEEPPSPVAPKPEPPRKKNSAPPPQADTGPLLEQDEEAALGVQMLVAYRGAPYAPDVPWTHGAHVALAVRHRVGACVSLGYTFTPPVEVSTEFGNFDVARYPAELLAGWCFGLGDFGVSPKLGILVEATTRRAAQPSTGVGVSSSSSNTGVAAVTALAAHWAASDRARLLLALSSAYFASDLEYLAAGAEAPLFSPYQVRLRVDVGAELVAF